MELLHTFEQNAFFFYLSLGLLGLIVGSFLNVVIYRLPIMLQKNWRIECLSFLQQDDPQQTVDEPFNLSQPRSRCPSCKQAITALENIPVISYIFLMGRCRHCRSPISIRYPIIELLSAALALIIAFEFGVSLQTGFAVIFTWVLICLTMIDIDTQLLPDSITLPLLWLALFASLLNIFVDPTTAIIGALAGYLSLWCVFWLFKLITGKEGMGYGDFKLLAAIGALLGWQLLPLVIILSAFSGAVIGISMIVFKGQNKHKAIPFGPYLSIAAFIALIWGDTINASYLQFVGL
ncbi:MAG: prepilin peptidase [Cycloclasticus sp.]|nr:prepilin peptidase [Cycloclasticus sp.]MBQ0790547.1 prepilin peptidase [Cycloclasticus sp.]